MSTLRDRARAFLARKFVRDTLFLQSATALDFVGQVVVFAAITRGLGLRGYGVYTQVNRTFELLTLICGLGFIEATISRLPAAVAAGNRERVRELLAFFLKISLLTTAIVLAVGLPGAELITRLYLNRAGTFIPWLVRLTLLAVPLGIGSRLVTTALLGSRRMEELSYFENLSALVRMGTVLLAVLLFVARPAQEAILAVVCARVLATAINSGMGLVLYRRWRRRYLAKEKRDVDLPALGEVLRLVPRVSMRGHLSFSLAIAADKNVASLLPLVPFAILGYTVGQAQKDAAMALFQAAQTLLKLPLAALNAVARNTLAKLSEQAGKAQRKKLVHAFDRVALVSGGISLALVVPFVLVAPWVVLLASGRRFQDCVPYLRVLAIYAAIGGIATPFGAVFRVYERIFPSIVIKLVAVAAFVPAAYLWARDSTDPTLVVSWVYVAQMISIVLIALVYLRGVLLRRDPPGASPVPAGT